MFHTALPVTSHWPRDSRETTPHCKGDWEMSSSPFSLWVVTCPAKNRISMEAGARQCEGVGCDDNQVSGSLGEVSRPTLLHRLLLLFLPLNPHNSFPVPHNSILQTSSLSPLRSPRFHGLALDSLVLFSHSLLLSNYRNLEIRKETVASCVNTWGAFFFFSWYHIDHFKHIPP